MSGLTKDAFGPLGVFLLGCPAIILVLIVAYLGIEQYDQLVSSQDHVLRDRLLSTEAKLLWPGSGLLNPSWDDAAAPIFATYKLRVFFALVFAPIFVGAVYVTFPQKMWPRYEGEMPKDLGKAAKIYFTVSGLMVLFGTGNALITLGVVPISSCTSLSFSACVGRHAFIICFGIWVSIYFLWAAIEFSRLSHLGVKQ